jgi:hypothetical protein
MGFKGARQKVVIPAEAGIHALKVFEKHMNCEPLPDMTRLRGNDKEALSRLFIVASSRTCISVDTYTARTLSYIADTEYMMDQTNGFSAQYFQINYLNN